MSFDEHADMIGIVVLAAWPQVITCSPWISVCTSRVEYYPGSLQRVQTDGGLVSEVQE